MRRPPKAATVPPEQESKPIELDEDQSAAAGIDPSERQIVLAPPGSGKTEVVASLLESLNDQGLEPRDEILAISFSRAAVAALRRRSGRGASPAPAIRTLDSLASRMLDEADEQEWRHLTFDKRIERARAILTGDAEIADLQLVRHLVIDEVQDLVGVRAGLVLTMIDSLDPDVGFTLLGDPDQAIYDFQLDTGEGMTSAELLDRVRKDPRVAERRLTYQYRARTREARQAATLLASRPSGADRTSIVRSFLAGVTSGGDIADVGRAAQRWTGSTAFLCRDNGRALMVSRALREAGIPVETRAPAVELPVAPWVARVFRESATRVVRRADIEDRLSVLAPMHPDDAWRLLKTAERDFRTGDRIDLVRLRAAVARRNLPSELLDGATVGTTVVSTIHRAKGLEFDNVVVVNAKDLVKGDASDEEASIAYVAVTRARDRLVTATLDVPWGLRKDNRSQRWYVGGREPWMNFGFEVRGGDTQSPTDGDDGHRVAELPAGAPVTAELDRTRSSLEIPIYRFLYQERVVAESTEAFGQVLVKRIRTAHQREGRPWPGLSGLVMESLETRAAMDAPLSDGSGLDLAMRIGGMADLQWKEG